jgi:hypothetical protein
MIADAASIFAVKVFARMGSVMPMQNVGINRLTKRTAANRNGEPARVLHFK